jgi:hypothetical protein
MSKNSIDIDLYSRYLFGSKGKRIFLTVQKFLSDYVVKETMPIYIAGGIACRLWLLQEVSIPMLDKNGKEISLSAF